MEARDRLNEALSDHYRLEEEIGRGGMAVVFRARDLRHDRDVAFKVLLPEIAAVLGPARFLREVELAAGLTHPVILPIFDSGQVGDLLYFVMPYIDGESLADRIRREGKIPQDEALSIARELTDGLQYAHDAGVVHRDIKPGNVLLSDRHAWIADFGVALPIGPDAAEHLTRTGLAIGTPAYMSPEQAAGDRTIDGRTDIYALACVLYEMLSGQVPFDGPTPQAMLVRRLTQEPAPVRSLNRAVSPGVERALAKAMARQPEERFQTATEFGDALEVGGSLFGGGLGSIGRRFGHRARARILPHPILVPLLAMLLVGSVAAFAWLLTTGDAPGPGSTVAGSSETGPPSVSVAVLLPRTPAPDDDLSGYGEALTDELIRRLGAIDGLDTRSLRAVLPFESTSTPPDSIGRALGVEFLVESSLLGSPDSLRFNLSLVDAATGAVLDEGRHEAARGEVLSLVDSVTSEVAFSLRQRLGGEFRVRELQAETDDEEAWRLVRQAETNRQRAIDAAALGGENRVRAIAMLDESDQLLARASGLDPAWSEPHVQSGWNSLERALVEGDEARIFGPEDTELLAAAVAASDEALYRDSISAEAMALRGTALHGLTNLESDPDRRAGLDREAASWLERAIATDAEQIDALVALANHARFHQGESERALALLRRAYESDRWLTAAEVHASAITELSTDVAEYDEAWERVLEGRRRWPDNFEFPALGLIVLASNGSDVDAAWAVADTVAEMVALDRADPYRLLMDVQVACVIARAGLADSARMVLEKTEAAAASDMELESFLAYDLAHAWLVHGDTSRAMDWLEVDIAANPGSRALRGTEAWFQPLHGTPRFEALVGEPSYSTAP
jgi:serine/threonine-protein kinase